MGALLESNELLAAASRRPPKPTVINLFAGPGAGKSTTAAGLFNLMKHRGHSVELVTEFAKDLTWSRNHRDLDNQLYVLGEQDQRLFRLRGQARFAITDSPLLLSAIYAKGRHQEPWFTYAVHGAFLSYENVNVRIRRTKPSRTEGRSQSLSEARSLDDHIAFLLKDQGGPHLDIDGDLEAPGRIYNYLTKKGMLAYV